jgi:hypothetical protein
MDQVTVIRAVLGVIAVILIVILIQRRRNRVR